MLLECLRACPAAAVYASEEQDGAIVLRTRAEGALYCVLADPLDGSSVVLVLSIGRGVAMYVLDPLLGDFVLVQDGLCVPTTSKTYSLNEACVNDFEGGLEAYLGWAHASGYGARDIGPMVADVHRSLLKGGVFLYPGTKKAPEGKLRLLYEGSRMAFVIEQAGGAASSGRGPLLDVTPSKLRQRTPVVIGSAGEVEHVLRHLRS